MILKYTENEQGKGKVVNNISKTLKPKLTGGYNSVKNPESAKLLFETLKNNSSMSVDDATKVISNLDKTTISYANTADRASLSIEGLKEHTKLTGSAFGTLAKNMALNMGVMLAIGVAMKVAVYAFDKANTTFDEQKEKVDGLQKSYEKLKSELDVLEGKNADDLTPAENARLDYLKRRLELEEKLLAIENRKLADSNIYGKGDIFSQGIEGKMAGEKSNSADSKYFVSKDLKELKKVQSEIANLDEGASNYQIYLDALLSKEEKLKEAIEGRTSSLMESEGKLRDAYDEIQGYIDSGAYDNDAQEKGKAQSLANSYLEQANNIKNLLADTDFVVGVSVELNESQIADLKNEIKSKLENSFADAVNAMSESELKVAVKIQPKDGETPEQWSERIKGIAQTVDVEIDLDVERSQKSLTDALSQIDRYKKLLEDLKETGGVANSEIIQSFPELLAYMGDQELLQEKINEKIAEQEAVYRQAQSSILDSSKEFYSTMILNNAQMISSFREDYGIDLSNFSSLAEAKLKLEAELVSKLANLWAQYYGAAGGYDSERMNIYEAQDQSKLDDKTRSMVAQAKALRAPYTKALNSMNSIKNSAMSTMNSGVSKPKLSGGGDGNGSKGGGSAKEIEAYKAKIDAYKKLQDELDKIQADISANEKKASNTKDDKEKIALIQQRIILTQKEQTALHNLNNARDEELAKNVKLLKQKGFKVDYNADSNELEIKNLEHLNGLKGAGQEKTNELIKENEELIKSTESLNEANKKGSETWWDSYYNLSKYNEEIEDLNRSIFKDKVEDLDFGTIYYDGIAGQESKIIDIYKDIISKTQTETDREYAKGLTDNDSYVQELIKKRKDYVDKIKSLNKEIYDNEVARQEHIIDLMSKREGTENQQIKIYENMKDNTLKKRQELIDDDYALHVDEIQKLEKDWTAYYDNVLNLQKKQLEDKRKLLESKKDNKDSATSAVNKTIDNEIKRLEKQKDALSKVNEERQKQIDLEKRQMELERAKSQKTSLIYRENRGFDYEADESAIKDAQNALDDFSVSGKQQDEQDALQKEIDSLQEYKEKWNDITNVVTDAQNEQKATMELGSNWKAAILNKDIGKLEDFKDGYVDVETSINDVSKSIEGIVNEMAEHINEDFTKITDTFKDAADSFAEFLNSINGTSKSKTYYAETDGSAPDDAKIGDKVKTRSGTYEITKENTEGSKYNEATGNWSKLIDSVSSKIDKSNAGTLAYTETLAANNLNLQEANKAQTANTEGILGNNLLVRDNSGVVKTNSDDVINNSSTVSDNTSLISESNNWIDNLIETLKESSKEIAKAARSTLDAADRAEKAAAKAKESSKSAGKRHSGGIIGNGIDRHKKLYDLSQYELKPDEELNILQEDEGVFTKEQMDNIIKLIDAPSMLKLDLNSDAFKNFNTSPTKLNIPNYEIPDISSIQTNQNKETIYNQSTNIANVNFSDIQEVKQIQEAIITLPQYAKQKSTSDYRK